MPSGIVIKQMKIIIAGGGKIGRSLARQLSAEGHDLTVIDQNDNTLELVEDTYDVMTVHGNCATMAVLREAGIAHADVLIAATRADEVNLLCCMTAHALNINLHTLARIRNPEYYEQIFELREKFALSLMFNPEYMTAREIFRLLEYPGFLQRDSFVKDRVEIVELLIEKDSKLDAIAMSDLGKVTGCNVLVCTVVRDGQTIMPGGDFILNAGDHIYVTAPTSELTTLLKSIGLISKKISHVLLCGGSRISFYLADILLKNGRHVRILESDPTRCKELADAFPDADIIHGDASNQATLEQEASTECDAVVALTGLDEMNIVISVFAHDMHVPHIVTKVGRMESMSLVDRLEVGSAVCPLELTGGTIVRYVRAIKDQSTAAITVHSIASGNAEASEFYVTENTRYIGVPLRDIPFRKNCLLSGIGHHGKTEIPNGNSVFEEGDIVVVVTSTDTTIEQLNDIFE